MREFVVTHTGRNGPTYYLNRHGEFTVSADGAQVFKNAHAATRYAERAAEEYGWATEVHEVATREENPVPASSRAGRHAPAGNNVKKAANLYERFTGNAAQKKARVLTEPDRAFLQVGTVDGILYTTNRDGKREQYIHHFRPQSRPALAVSHDGKVARTVGGRFTFTERGFVDEDASGAPVE